MKKKHNVLFIDSGFGYGGSAVFLYEFLHHLDREKFNPMVAFYYPIQAKDAKRIEDLGIEVVSLGMKAEEYCLSTASGSQGGRGRKLKSYLTTLWNFILQDLSAILRMVKLIKERRIELVVLNNDVHYHVPGVLAAKLAGAGCLCRKAGIGGGRKIKKVLGRFVDVFWAISDATALDQIQMKVPTKRLVTFYTGVDTEKYDPAKTNKEIRKELKLSEDRPIIGSISRVEEGKGHRELVQAASLVVKEFPRTIFLMVGDELESGGVLLQRLKQEVAHLGLTENFIFLGWRTDILNILSGVDVFVHCPNSLAEGLPIATLEAMAMGKPTIVSDNFGLKETTEDNVTGFVVPKGDVSALSQAISILLRDRELAADMGRRARLRAEKLFDIQKNVHQAEKLLLDLLN